MNRMKNEVDAQIRDNKLDAVRIGRSQTKLQHYGSSLNNQLSATEHCTSTSLIMKRQLTV
ncbi:unnamed protein product [Schistosoma curassoni]|uniref:V-SNARE coiled-coil homology domain-containing protein n=1 Tax=Schistosoma curassoni TaxID=6186 RepID=A0A183KHM8_9TREM|nr:unnamed protein product [Schistosoma curassoni]